MTVQPRYVEDRPDYNVNLGPFARFNWKTAESRELLAVPLGRFSEAKDEAEWRSIMDDRTDREAAIVYVTNDNRERWLERVSEHGLHYKAIRYAKPYDGFAHTHDETHPFDPERLTYSVIATDEAVAERVYEAETGGDGKRRHDIVGEALGFPKCCRAFFGDVWVDGHDDGLWDPIYEIACNTPSAEVITDEENVRVTDPDPYCDTMWRYFGWGFITHFPCSFECEESARIGAARHDIMRDLGYGDAADIGCRFLDEPRVWDAYKSIATVRNMHVTGTAGSSSYWSKKRVEWRREHFPRMKDVYTDEDLAGINH